jgi:hypothetical protein
MMWIKVLRSHQIEIMGLNSRTLARQVSGVERGYAAGERNLWMR